MVPTRRYRVPALPALRVHVADLGLACCAVEFVAAVARGLLVPDPTALVPDPISDVSPVPQEAVGDPGGHPAGGAVGADVHVLIVSGTVTNALLPSVAQVWASLPDPRAAIAFGACTISGGPYWDSYAVAAGIDQAIPVTRYVPGCPPRPEALLEALAALADSVIAVRVE